MKNHPAYRKQNIEAQRAAGVDPQIGKWPGDPDYTGPIGETGDGRLIYGYKDGKPVFEQTDYGSEELNALAAGARAVRKFIDEELEPTCRNPIGDKLSTHPEEAIDELAIKRPASFDLKPGTTVAEREAAKRVFDAVFQLNQATKNASQTGLTIDLRTLDIQVTGQPTQPKVWTKVSKVTSFPVED